MRPLLYTPVENIAALYLQIIWFVIEIQRVELLDIEDMNEWMNDLNKIQAEVISL